MHVIDRRRFVKGAAAFGALAAFGGGARHAYADDKLAAVIEAAKKEGAFKLVDFFDRDVADGFLKPFQAQYPFLTNIEYEVVPGAQKLARFTQEAMAGGPTTDVMSSGVASLHDLAIKGHLLEVDWKALEMPEISDRATPTPHMAMQTSVINGVAYNTNKVKEADVPKTWDDVANPKWKGKIGAWARQGSVFVALAAKWGEEKARDYSKKIAALEPMLLQAFLPVTQRVGAGELDIGFSTYDSSSTVIASGAPVKFVALDPTPVSILYASVSKYAKNPNAAKLFLRWLNTTEGAVIFEKVTSGRGNFAVAQTKASELVKGLDLAYFSVKESIDNNAKMNALEKEFNDMLQKR